MNKTGKARKGLIISLFTLVIALAVAATSTYAWFVVNKEVTASNMQVTVKADTTYLVIKKADSLPANVDALGTETSASMDASDAQVLPVMYDENESGSGVIKWKTGVGTSYTNGAAIDGEDEGSDPDYTSISSAAVTAGTYFVKYTFYVGLTSTSAVAAQHLRVKQMTATANSTANNADTFLPAISAVVTCRIGDGAETAIDYEDIGAVNNSTPGTYYSGKGDLAATVAQNTVYTIDVYVYVNGDNTVVTSANAAKLGGFKLSITFDCQQATA
jgi:hypothetical protein